MKYRSITIFLTKVKAWILFPVLLLIFNLLVGFNGLYGQDSFEYLRYSRELHEYLSGGLLPGAFFWPVLYPLSGALVSFILPDVVALQVVSILCYGLTILFLRRILVSLYPVRERETALYLMLFFSISPFVLRYASFVMSDSMAMFFLSAFFYYWLIYKGKGKNRHFVFLVLFASLAINTRYASIAIVIIPGVSALITFLRRFNLRFFIFSLLVIVIVFLPDIILEIQGSPSFPGPILLPDWSVKNFFKFEFFNAGGHHSYTFPNICFVFSNLVNPGFIFSGIIFFFLLKGQIIYQPFLRIILIVLVIYALFLAGFSTQNSRFLLVTFPCVLILYSESFFRCLDLIAKTISSAFKLEIIEKASKRVLFIIITSVFIMQMLLFYRAFKPSYIDCRIVQEIASRMKAYPDKTIYTFNIDMGLKAYDVSNEIINLWPSRINYFKPGSLILFNYVNLYRQWKDLNPFYNWEKVNNEHDVLLIDKLPGGWNLYEIKN